MNRLWRTLFLCRGRLDRATFQIRVALPLIAYIAIGKDGLPPLLSALRGDAPPLAQGRAQDIATLAVIAAYAGLGAWVALAQIIKRLHDRGRPGWWSFGAALPWAGAWIGLWVTVETMLLAGNAGPNAYGPAPGTPAPATSTPGRRLRPVLLGLAIIALAYATPIGLRTLALEEFRIPSGSMKPGLFAGDYIWVAKSAYGYSRYTTRPWNPPLTGRFLGFWPQRGDVVVFRLPHDPPTDYVKRVIGLPGDTVQIRDSRLWLNGALVDRAEIGLFADPDRETDAYTSEYLEMLPGGRSYAILQGDHDAGLAANTPLYTVPPGTLFMLGDNRSDSQDSRYLDRVGYIPYENLIGRAAYRGFSSAAQVPLLPLRQWLDTLRYWRILTAIR